MPATPAETPSHIATDADLEALRSWIGRGEERSDQITPTPLQAMGATLVHAMPSLAPGAPLPPLWHWLYFLPLHDHDELGPDGHIERGGFVPPVPLPRRMWAGSQITFHQPIRVGDAVQRHSSIADVSTKSGRSGRLVFVKVRHAVHRQAPGDAGAQLAITEFQDIVYREAARPGEAAPAPTAAPTGAAWQRTVVADPVLLFRYSALTFNGHRIHYDRPYVTGVEGYPGLVVHGPLIATLLLDLLRRQQPQAEVASFQFRAIRPTFDLHPFTVQGQPAADGRSAHLFASDHEGWLTMDAQVTLR